MQYFLRSVVCSVSVMMIMATLRMRGVDHNHVQDIAVCHAALTCLESGSDDNALRIPSSHIMSLYLSSVERESYTLTLCILYDILLKKMKQLSSLYEHYPQKLFREVVCDDEYPVFLAWHSPVIMRYLIIVAADSAAKACIVLPRARC